MSKNVSVIIKKNRLEKILNQPMFILSCYIGNRKVNYAMLDLGSLIIVMSFHVYQHLKINNMQETKVSIQLVDRLYATDLQIVEDILIKLV